MDLPVHLGLVCPVHVAECVKLCYEYVFVRCVGYV